MTPQEEERERIWEEVNNFKSEHKGYDYSWGFIDCKRKVLALLEGKK